MKKLITLVTLFLISTSFIINSLDTTSVYICTGKYSKKYHYEEDCRGLSNCKTKIKEVDITTAKEFGRTLCGWED